jgi:phosphoribosylformylglycinamidine synthase PurS subunit
MRARVFVRLRENILDVPGTSVKQSLHRLGFAEVVDLRVGKVIDVDLATEDAGLARRRLEEMCQRLLVNPVIERFNIEMDLASESGPCQRAGRGVE